MNAISRLLAIAAAGTLFINAGSAAQHAPEAEISSKTTVLFSQGDYRFVIEQTLSKFPGDAEWLDMEQTLIVMQNDREIDRHDGWRWEVYSAEGFFEPRPATPGPGSDVTGDGVPDLVLMEYSGGAHCCSTYYVFELDATPRVQELATGDSPIFFKQLDGEPGLEVEFYDNAFAYWRASFASSAMPKVVLRHQGGSYGPAPDLMRNPAPSAAQLAIWAEKARNADDWVMKSEPPGGKGLRQDLSSDFLAPVVDLVYQGHADLVRTFVDKAWPLAKPGKEDFIAELMECRIRRSKYWPTIAAMNGLPADPPIGKCD